VKDITLWQAVILVREKTGQELAEVSLRAACARDALKAEKIGKSWVVTEENLMQYINQRPTRFQPERRKDIVVEEGKRGIIWYSQ